MLSILIPVYNYNVYPLVSELHKQCMEGKIDFEIIVIDDGSDSEINKENDRINLLSNCVFTALTKNGGLSSNRNLLASKAKYPHFLFIDGDSIVINTNYIKNFIDAIDTTTIIYGGRVHPPSVATPKQKLRWKYGKTIEDKTAAQRNLAVYKTLMFNNTLIKKSCFDHIKFDSGLKKYGHEDTLFAYQVSLSSYSVKHLDNAIEHGDIDTNLVYLNKTKQSLENLISLYGEEKIDIEFVRLIQLYHFLKRTKSTFIISKIHSLFERYLSQNLTGNNPNLLLFNWFRVGYLCSINDKINSF